MHAHPGGAIARQQYAVNQGVAHHLEVRPPARRLQIGVIGGHAPPFATVDRVARDTLCLRIVEVRVPGIAECQRRVPQRQIHRPPALRRRAGDGQPAARTAELWIVLDRVEQRQHVGRGPSLAPRLGPGVERRTDAADGDLRVHRRTAAERATTPVEPGLLTAGAPCHQPRPLPVRLVDGLMHERDDVGAQQRRWRLVRPPVAAGLQ